MGQKSPLKIKAFGHGGRMLTTIGLIVLCLMGFVAVFFALVVLIFGIQMKQQEHAEARKKKVLSGLPLGFQTLVAPNRSDLRFLVLLAWDQKELRLDIARTQEDAENKKREWDKLFSGMEIQKMFVRHGIITVVSGGQEFHAHPLRGLWKCTCAEDEEES